MIDQWKLIKGTHLFITLKLLWKILIGREDFESKTDKLVFLISSNHIPDPRSPSNHVRRRLISELMITLLPSKSKTTIWDDKQTDNLNFIWLFILQNQPDTASMALKMDQSELNMISKLNADLIGGMASVLDDLCSHWLPTTANQNLFQVMADVFCHFVEIIESNILSCIDFRYAEFHLAANYIQRAFIPINELIKFRKIVEKFFKKGMALKLRVQFPAQK